MMSHRAKLSHQPTISFVQTVLEPHPHAQTVPQQFLPSVLEPHPYAQTIPQPFLQVSSSRTLTIKQSHSLSSVSRSNSPTAFPPSVLEPHPHAQTVPQPFLRVSSSRTLTIKQSHSVFSECPLAAPSRSNSPTAFSPSVLEPHAQTVPQPFLRVSSSRTLTLKQSHSIFSESAPSRSNSPTAFSPNVLESRAQTVPQPFLRVSLSRTLKQSHSLFSLAFRNHPLFNHSHDQVFLYKCTWSKLSATVGHLDNHVYIKKMADLVLEGIGAVADILIQEVENRKKKKAEECKPTSRHPCLPEMKESWWRTSKKNGLIRFRAWEYFKDFSGNTSIHGIKYLGEENRHVFEKVCWVVFLLLSVGFCSHLIFKVWVKWNSSPVIVSFNEKSTPVWEIPFPAVTICSETKARQTLFNFTEAIMIYHLGNFTESELQKLGDVSLLCDKQYMKGDLLTNESVVNFYREFQYEWMRHGRSASNWSLERGYSPSSPVETYPYRALGAGYTAGLTTLLRSFSMDIDYLCKGAVPGFRDLQICRCAGQEAGYAIPRQEVKASHKSPVPEVERELHNQVKNSSAMTCDCLPACTGLQYDGETSSAHFDWESLLPAYNLSVNDPAYLGCGRSNDYSYNLPECSEVGDEVRFIPINHCICSSANCGGLLGLFMGISMLSLLEIFYYLTIRLSCDRNMRDWLEPRLGRTGTSLRHCRNNKMASENQIKEFSSDQSCIQFLTLGSDSEDRVLSGISLQTLHGLVVSDKTPSFDKEHKIFCKNLIAVCENYEQLSWINSWRSVDKFYVTSSGKMLIFYYGDIGLINYSNFTFASVIALFLAGGSPKGSKYQILNVGNGRVYGKRERARGLETTNPKISESINISLYECPPFVTYHQLDDNRSGVRYDGIEVRIIRAILGERVVNWKPLPDVLSKISKHTKVSLELQRGQADVGLCSMWLTNGRLAKIDMTIPWERVSLTFLVPRPKRLPSRMILYLAWDGKSWRNFLISVISFVLVLWMFSKTSPGEKEQLKLINGFFDVVAISVTNSPSADPLPNSLGVLFLSWSFFSLLATTSYSTEYTSLLASPPYSSSVDSVRELVSEGLYWGDVIDGVKGMLHYTDDKYIVEFVGRFRLETGEGQREERVARGDYAVFSQVMEDLLVESNLLSVTVRGKMMVMKEPLMTLLISIGLRKNSRYKRWFDEKISWMAEAGLINHWREDVVRRYRLYYMKDMFRILVNEDEPEPLSAESLEGAFYLVCLGLILAGVVFILELGTVDRIEPYSLKLPSLMKFLLAVENVKESRYEILNLMRGHLYENYQRNVSLKIRQRKYLKSNLLKDHREINISLFECPPFVIYIHSEENRTEIEYDGIEVRMIRAILSGWKIRWRPLTDLPSNKTSISGYKKLYLDIRKRRSDVALCSLWMTYGRMTVIDMTIPWERLLLTFLVPRPKKLPAGMLICLAWSGDSWRNFLFSLIFFTIVLLMFSKISPGKNLHENIVVVIFDIIAISVGNSPSSVTCLPNCLRILFLSWALLSLLAMTSYSTEYTSLLSSPPYSSPIDSVEDLVNKGLYWGEDTFGRDAKLRYTEDKYILEFADRFRLETDKGQREDRVSRGDYAIFSQVLSGILIEENSMSETVRSSVRMMQQPLIALPIAIGLQKNSPYKPFFDEKISQMIEAGLIDHWGKCLARTYGLFPLSQTTDEPEPLRFDSFEGAFYLLGFGLILARLYGVGLIFMEVLADHSVPVPLGTLGEPTCLEFDLQEESNIFIYIIELKSTLQQNTPSTRLTCLVCRHRPIFDTLSTLAMHRKGKKHLYELGKYLACKRSHELKQLKADHKDFVRTGVVSIEPLPVPPAQTKLLAHSVPYSSCVRRKTSVLRRKPVLGVSCMPEFDISLSGVTTGAKPSANSQVRKYLKGLWKKRSLEKTVAKCRENYGGKLGHQNIKDVVAESSALKNGQEVRTESVSIVASAGASDGFKDIGAPQSASITAQKEASHYIQLRMSGWIKDAKGNWVKDPEAEFDSDEDEPPPLPT
uniref:Uncharacterized protein n=1 Tax=Timema tahoe TaxID=61484 RepID=A0A7R9IB21_9NEOP|nr:unnamed protein product [Timema tahoe]